MREVDDEHAQDEEADTGDEEDAKPVSESTWSKGRKRVCARACRVADRGQRLERGDANEGARERRRGRRDASRPQLERGQVQLLCSGNRSALRAERAESRPEF